MAESAVVIAIGGLQGLPAGSNRLVRLSCHEVSKEPADRFQQHVVVVRAGPVVVGRRLVVRPNFAEAESHLTAERQKS